MRVEGGRHRPRLGRWLAAGGAAFTLLLLAMGAPMAGAVLTDALAEQFATDLPQSRLSADQRDSLLTLARGRAEPQALGGVEIHAAHSSVYVDDLLAAISGDYQSIEGDVGLVGDIAVLRHDVRDPVGMTLDEWLEVVAAARFPIVKIDFKRDKVGPLIDQLRTGIARHGIREEQLKLNVDVVEGPGAYAGLSWRERLYSRLVLKLEPADAVELAHAFPGVAISIGAWVGEVDAGVRYSAADIAAFREVAGSLRRAGSERVVISARWDLLTPEFVAALAASGTVVDVWNAPELAAPDDVALERRRLREEFGAALGVIDLRR